jgi:hypothetical protein
MPASWIILYKSLWALNVLISALVVWRLFTLSLIKTYRFFFGSMVLSLARSAVLFPFSAHGDRTYYQIWLATQPLLWLSYVLVVFELYALVLHRYRGIFSLSRFFFFSAVATSSVFSLLTILPTTVAAPSDSTLIYHYALIERGVVTSLAIFLLLLLLLALWFPIPMSRNLLTHCVVYSAYFFGSNVVFLYRQLSGRDAAYAGNIAKLSIALVCLLCWVVGLTKRGEDRITSLCLRRDPLLEKRLLGRLDDFNETLLRTVRK